MSRKLRFVFLISLLLNGLVVGLLVGGLPHRFDGRRGFEQRVDQVLARLPQDVQDRFRAGTERGRTEDDARRERIRDARRRAIEILGSEPLDLDAYDREVQIIDSLRGQGARDMAATIRELASDLPVEQRRVLAELLDRPPRRDR
jgi:uncharacterized membrane protein